MDEDTPLTSYFSPFDGAQYLRCSRPGCEGWARATGPLGSRCYCTPECARAAWNEQRREKRAREAEQRPMVPCEWCEEPFRPKRSDARFCKVACRVAYHRHPEGPPRPTGVVRRADNDRDEKARQALRAVLDNPDATEDEMNAAAVKAYTVLAGRSPSM